MIKKSRERSTFHSKTAPLSTKGHHHAKPNLLHLPLLDPP